MSLSEAYLPSSSTIFIWVMVAFVLCLSFGFMCTLWSRNHPRLARLLSWGMLLGGFLGLSHICDTQAAGFRMLSIIGIVLFSMKSVVACEVAIRKGIVLSFGRWIAWAALWPGMAPEIFDKTESNNATYQARELLLRGIWRLLIGVCFLYTAHQLHQQNISIIIVTCVLLPGISLILHFGIFNINAALWRWRGIPTTVLFPAPLLSYSLSEFWGKRWNLPFTEMIQRGVYQPLQPIFGRSVAAMIGFLFSGLLHECAISHPVKQGYGYPLLYFAVHGFLVLLERKTGVKRYLSSRPYMARIWTLSCLVIPMPILFHSPFLKGVVWPLIGISF